MARRAKDHKTVAALSEKMKGTGDLEAGMALYVNAYIDLDSEREWLRPIPWSAMVAYSRFYGLNHRQTEDLILYLRMIDADILKERAKDAERNAARSGKRS